MSRDERLSEVLRSGRRNALIAWLLLGFLLLVVVESVASDDLLWAGFAGVVAVLALVPTIAHRDPRVTLPWEVLALAALPILGRAFATLELTSDFATYLAVAAIALVIAVELHAFTPVEMTPGFAVAFVVVATMAAAGVWAVVRWGLDVTLGTHFLVESGIPEAEMEAHLEEVEEALMWEFVYSTAAGIAAGFLFEGYFRRYVRVGDRLPEDATVTADGGEGAS